MAYLYEFSISAQLSGAILLLFWCFSKISKNVLDMCFPRVIFAKRKETGELYIEKEIVQQKVKNIFLNVSALLFDYDDKIKREIKKLYGKRSKFFAQWNKRNYQG